MDLLGRLFGRQASKEQAKDRLRLVLVHDRSVIAPHTMEALRRELIDVISRYLEIDTEGVEVDLTNEESAVALVANIPVKSVRRSPGGG